MNYYLDFDYTLFDTHAFRQGLYEILEINGFDKTALALTPEMKSNGQELLNIKKLFTNLAQSRNIPIENFLNPLEKLYERCYEFVYSDTVEFLKYLKTQKHNIFVLTWGEKNFQEEKFTASKLGEYVDQVIYAEELKYTLDIDYPNGIFVDDSIRDLEGLYRQNAKKVYRIIRPNGKNSDKKLPEELVEKIPEFNSLKELQEYLKQQDVDAR